ncbi:hypothetical protein SAMN04488104_100869 [Algoriphagus faecimaris]|uniref:Uncharacterized protein n=1 Tax=Algoriphagus faecimaris TaxID=686796 RepID=A0A1G6Q631_9BACT|nr:hypothetical protein SAMN04488104_100869 [Algoriphagus faecimaris]
MDEQVYKMSECFKKFPEGFLKNRGIAFLEKEV